MNETLAPSSIKVGTPDNPRLQPESGTHLNRLEQLGEHRWYLKENQEYKALLLDGRVLDIVFPPQVPLKVA